MSDLVARLRARREIVWAECKKIVDAAADANRNLDTEECRAYDSANLELDQLDARIKGALEGEMRRRDTEQLFDDLTGRPREQRTPGRSGETELRGQFARAANERDPRPITISAGRFGEIESRALTTASGTAGSLLPLNFFDSIVERMLDESGTLAAGPTVIVSQDGAPLAIPRATAYPTAAWVSEGANIGLSDPVLSTVVLAPHKCGFITVVTNEAISDTSFDLTGFLARAAGTSIGQLVGPSVVSGASGLNAPRGFTIDANVAAVTGASGQGGAMTADNIIELVYSLGDSYLRAPKCGFVMNKNTLKGIRKLKAGGTGDYLFSADLRPDARSAGTLMGYPVYVDQWVPSAATGAISCWFGDWSRFYVRMVGDLRWEHDASLGPGFQADSTWFRGIARIDSALIDSSALVSFKGGT